MVQRTNQGDSKIKISKRKPLGNDMDLIEPDD